MAALVDTKSAAHVARDMALELDLEAYGRASEALTARVRAGAAVSPWRRADQPTPVTRLA